MSTISTHVLDTSRGTPAAGVPVSLAHVGASGAVTKLGAGTTDAEGRVLTLLPAERSLEPGDYRLRFDTAAYLAQAGQPVFYPIVTVDFRVAAPGAHYHVPLLLSPFGYSTYRGS